MMKRMRPFTQKPATVDDLKRVPVTMVGEIVGGELVASPRPSPLHSNAALGLGAGLRDPFQHGTGGPGGWWILVEPEIHHGADIVVPDLAGWRRETLQELPQQSFISVRPDWICEVLSPSTAGFDRVRKMPVYLREGVGHVWLVDPATRTVEVFRNAGREWALAGSYAGDSRERLPPFDAVELDLSKLWA